MLGDSTQNEAELLQVTVVIIKKIESDRTALCLGCFTDQKEVEINYLVIVVRMRLNCLK